MHWLWPASFKLLCNIVLGLSYALWFRPRPWLYTTKMVINQPTMICWILSRPIGNIQPLAAALKLVGGGMGNFQVPANKLTLGLCWCVIRLCQSVCGNNERSCGGGRKDSLCLCGCEHQRKHLIEMGADKKQGSKLWPFDRGASNGHTYKGYKPVCGLQRGDCVTDSGSSRRLLAWKDWDKGNSTGSIQDP